MIARKKIFIFILYLLLSSFSQRKKRDAEKQSVNQIGKLCVSAPLLTLRENFVTLVIYHI